MDILDVMLSLFSLTLLEIVLGVDNLIFLSIMTERLPLKLRKKARFMGLTFAWMTRLILLFSVCWLTSLTQPILFLGKVTLSARDIFLILGGLFLLFKATEEIHQQVMHVTKDLVQEFNKKYNAFYAVVVQIGLMDIIFSLDSVLTAIGLTTKFWIMAIAITIAILVMLFASKPASEFIEKFPSLKILALCFLLLIGMVLIADGLGVYIPRGYVYFSMLFSLMVETFNLLAQHRQKIVRGKK